MKSTESDVCYFEVDAVFNREPVELLEESMWTVATGVAPPPSLLLSTLSFLARKHFTLCHFFF